MKLGRTASSLVTRLIAIGLLLVILGSAAVYFQISAFMRKDLTQVISAQQMTLAEYVARDVEASLEARRRLLDQLAATLPRELLEQPALLRGWLKARHELQPLFSIGLMVADTKGTLLGEFPPLPGRSGPSIADNPALHARDGQSVIGSPIKGNESMPASLPMGVPVKDGAGNVVAILIGTASLAAHGFLHRLLQARGAEASGILLISPRDKLFLASTEPAMVLTATPPAGVNLLHDRVMEGFRGIGTTINARGIEEISAIASVPSTGWFVVARLPTRHALAAVARTQGFIVRQGILAMILVFLVVGALITWLLRPLYRAADQAERMTRGEIPLAPLPVIRADEVGHLTAAFNRLLANLGSKQAELERMAHSDSLTGLPNRKVLADRMQQALARAQRNATSVALLYLDLDGFKRINDTLGHEAGDGALKELTHRLVMGLRQTDTLARMGGDEFVLLAADLEAPAENGVRILAKKCIDAIAEPLHLQGSDRTLGVSIGIALCNGGCSPDRLLVAADQAMYAAKAKGRGGYVMASLACPHVKQA